MCPTKALAVGHEDGQSGFWSRMDISAPCHGRAHLIAFIWQGYDCVGAGVTMNPCWVHVGLAIHAGHDTARIPVLNLVVS